jgi:peptidoglycan/LPS O-acetylase OafA/YrhL
MAEARGYTFEMRTELRPLTGLRGIASLWVLAHHSLKLAADIDPFARLPLTALGKAGYLGVDIFFTLSGFVIALSYARMDISTSSYGRFLWKRLARIYPVHLATLLIFASTLTFRTVDADLSMSGLLRTLTLTHAWELPIDKVWHSISWSISAEWAAYMAFPAVALATQNLRPAAILTCISILFAALLIVLLVSPWPETFVYGMPRIAVEFTAGVLLYRLWCYTKHTINTLTITALLVMIFGGNLIDLVAGMGTAMFIMPILGCVIVYGLACSTGLLSMVFTRLEYLGHISYALYLFHMIPYGISQWLLAGQGDDTSAVYVAILASAGISLVGAHLLYRFVEQPARQWLLSAISPAERAQTISNR